MPNLTLYYRNTCGFCQLVLNHMNTNNIEIPMKDIATDPTYREELTAIGGKPQVPCLVIDGKALYESEDIIMWFKENWQA